MYYLWILFQERIRHNKIFVLKRGLGFDSLKNWSYSDQKSDKPLNWKRGGMELNEVSFCLTLEKQKLTNLKPEASSELPNATSSLNTRRNWELRDKYQLLVSGWTGIQLKNLWQLWAVFLEHTLPSVTEKGNQGRRNGENQKGQGKRFIWKLAVLSVIDLVARNSSS